MDDDDGVVCRAVFSLSWSSSLSLLIVIVVVVFDFKNGVRSDVKPLY